jgi:hypothetical protein
MGLRPAWIQTSLRIRAAWSGSMLVANPVCWFCHDAAQMLVFGCLFIFRIVREQDFKLSLGALDYLYKSLKNLEFKG